MKKKIKKILKSKIFVFALIALFFGTVGVYAATYFPSVDVTYDNKESGLVSTDVQGPLMSYTEKLNNVVMVKLMMLLKILK